jgi:hypothetical protein
MDHKKGYAFTFGESWYPFSSAGSMFMPYYSNVTCFTWFLARCTTQPTDTVTCFLTCAVGLVCPAACTLSAIHFLTAAASVIGAQVLGFAERAKLPMKGRRSMEAPHQHLTTGP